MAEPRISVVFPTRNRLDYLRRAVESLLAELSGRYEHELVIVDGGSTDGTLEYLAGFPTVRVVHEDAPRGCCYAFDLGLRAARGEWVCWLNDDVEVLPGAFDAMLAFMTAPENAQVGMGAFPSSRSRQEQDTFVVRGVWDHPVVYADFGFLRRELLADLGYLDLGFRKFSWDPDLALRVWERGLRVAPCPGAHVVHFFAEDALRKEGDANLALDTERLMRKWEVRRASCRFHSVYQDEAYCRTLLAYLTGWPRCQLLLHMGQEPGTDGGLAAEAAALFNPCNELSRRAYYAFGLELMRRRRFADALHAFGALYRAEAEGWGVDATRPWYACKAGQALLRAGQPELAMPWFALAAQGGVALALLHLAP
ncbi:MAG: glycosyltransferase, partial [Humidesulfovibrio sp.]|nr:glycosyltransferase [Humidesulfovibrio sp.]